jgi:hypothetical protein
MECGIIQAPPELQRFGITAMYGGAFSMSVVHIFFLLIFTLYETDMKGCCWNNS